MIKTFSNKNSENLEEKVNDWISSYPELDVKNIQFEIGLEDKKNIHYAYIWYEKKD